MPTKTLTMTEIMKEKNITQAELAKRLDCSQQAISQWCTNSTAPRARDIAKVAVALDVTAEEVLACFYKNEGETK